MSEECPNCETDLLVGKARGQYFRWVCHGCGEVWGELPQRPIDYDDVDQWYEPRSPDGTRLHTDRNCPRGDSVLVHTPEEARENRHERCLICGHEVFDQ